MKKTLLIFSMALVIIMGLNAQNPMKESRKLYKKIYKDKEQVAAAIKQEVELLRQNNSLTIEGEEVLSKKFLTRFYTERNYSPAWDNFDSFMDAIESLEGSHHDGLNPTDYNLDGMIRIRDAVLKEQDQRNPDYSWTAKLDILLTDAIFLYAYHLVDGKTDPGSLDPDWNFGFQDLPDDTPEALSLAIEEHTLLKDLDALRPDIEGYRMMMEELSEYRKIQEQGGWETIEGGGKIDPGDREPRIPAIRKRLAITGDLTNTWNMEDDLYDPELEIDIRSFQDRHGLDVDGVIGKGTFAALSIPVENKIAMLRVNLERARWIFNSIGTNFIIVNIARFKAYVVQEREIIHETNVMVGKTYHQTPVFKSKLAYMEFNPTWTVPASITRNEMIPKIKADSAYLSKNHMVLLDRSGNIVPESSIDFSNLSANNFPYTVRQEPGPWNALGEVKFIFPNDHSVFLHDTQAKGLFGRANRTFSHGCIRVQNPMELAEVLLQGTDWDRQKIDELVASRETRRLTPRIKYDVYLLYWTTGLMGSDKIYYLPDVYNRDEKVLKSLDEKVSRIRNSP